MSETEIVGRPTPRRGRRAKKAKKVALMGNAKKAGINMGREQLREGVENILKRHFPNGQCRGGGAHLKMHMTRSLDELGDAKAELMRDEAPDVIIILGGDGTTQKTLGEDPEFLDFLTSSDRASEIIVLGAGSKNVVPTALKLLGDDPLKAFDVVCQKITLGMDCDVICRPILKINGKHGFIYGSGVVVNALDAYYGHKAGPGRAFKTGLGVAWRETFGRLKPWGRRPSVFRRFDATVSWRDALGEMQVSEMRRFNAFVASTLHEVNPWLKITHRTGERLNCFHGLGLNNGFWRNGLNLPAMIFGAPMLGSVQDMVTDRMVIRYAADMRHTIDGESYGTTADLGTAAEGPRTVTIETGPRIKFIIG